MNLKIYCNLTTVNNDSFFEVVMKLQCYAKYGFICIHYNCENILRAMHIAVLPHKFSLPSSESSHMLQIFIFGNMLIY